eukprot:TRINITY_DN1126_c0_g1_i2.p1 TRINITY_DN1126_c0_g1~~TRINITY_DN1126_c0_g1_i2.p1  ORF type:complete len:179 (-),score=71.78 TRINITY_DN1126_c0_g1_i2:255-761(-)
MDEFLEFESAPSVPSAHSSSQFDQMMDAFESQPSYPPLPDSVQSFTSPSQFDSFSSSSPYQPSSVAADSSNIFAAAAPTSIPMEDVSAPYQHGSYESVASVPQSTFSMAQNDTLIREFEEKRQKELEVKKAQNDKKHQEILAQAQKDLANFYEERKKLIAQNIAKNRS